MRSWVALVAATVACAHAVPAQQPWNATPDGPKALGPFEALYQSFLDGLRRRDTTLYRKLLTEDYRYVGEESSRVIIGRPARLAHDAQTRDSLTEFVVERCDLAKRPTVAVGPCWFRMTGRSNGEVGAWRGVSLTTFVFEEGRWLIAATRPSAIPR